MHFKWKILALQKIIFSILILFDVDFLFNLFRRQCVIIDLLNNSNYHYGMTTWKFSFALCWFAWLNFKWEYLKNILFISYSFIRWLCMTVALNRCLIRKIHFISIYITLVIENNLSCPTRSSHWLSSVWYIYFTFRGQSRYNTH